MMTLRPALTMLAVVTTMTALTTPSRAATFDFDLSGPGVSASLVLTYGSATDSKYPEAFEVTGISGTFSDSNNGLDIVNAAISSIVPVTHDAPESTNLLAPHDFSRFAVATGTEHGSMSFDNLFYPGGSPQTATDYPFHGGVLDIYGLMFGIGDGKVVNVWSNGVLPNGVLDYGIGVATAAKSLDYVSDSVSPVPEPGTWMLFGAGLLVLMGSGRFDAAWRSMRGGRLSGLAQA